MVHVLVQGCLYVVWVNSTGMFTYSNPSLSKAYLETSLTICHFQQRCGFAYSHLLVPSKVNLHLYATVTANYMIFHHVSSLENQEVLSRKPKLAMMSMFRLGFNATNIKRAAVLRILPHRQSSMHTQTLTQCENVKPISHCLRKKKRPLCVIPVNMMKKGRPIVLNVAFSGILSHLQ